jgi:redox-sensitive bicupin YhaK (pirin superfamily)
MRRVIGVHVAPAGHWVGDGFPVRSLFSPSSPGDDLSPFLLLDYAAPFVFPPASKPRGVGQHPHRGFETVTIVYQGELEHRDSMGHGGRIGAGDVQWMTAASGLLHEELHSEVFTRTGGTMEMVQLWVNLPAKHKKAAPRYQTLLDVAIPSAKLEGGAGSVRVIAGDYLGHKGPAQTFTPIDIWDVRLNPGKSAELPLPEGHTAVLVVLSGAVMVNGEHIAREAQFVQFDRTGGGIAIEANGQAKALVLSGEPIKEPVVAQGPFVMNTTGEIKQAMLDFRNGQFGAMPSPRRRA